MISAILAHLIAFMTLPAANLQTAWADDACAYSTSSASDSQLITTDCTLPPQAVLIEMHAFKRDESSNKRNKISARPSRSLTEINSFPSAAKPLPAKDWIVRDKVYTGTGMQLNV